MVLNCYWVVNYASLPHNWNIHILTSDCKPVTCSLSHYALENGYQNFDLFFKNICYNMIGSKILTLCKILDILGLYPLYYNYYLTFSCDKYFVI